MILEMIRSEGLAHNSYLIGSGSECAVIDPRRDIDIYLEMSKKYDSRITHVFETHRNEDYVIGSCELMDAVDALVYHGSGLDFDYGRTVDEGDTFKIGDLRLDVIETPGHTDESISLILKDTTISHDPMMVFTGDALFAGDVGRTDLYGEEERERMAKNLYRSIHEKILPLGDHVVILPAHGQGSVCGENISDQPFTTVGYERRNNDLLKIDEEGFIKHKKEEDLHRPPYFRKMEVFNRYGAPPLDKYSHIPSLDHEELGDLDDIQLLDVRSPTAFSGAHIPGSINIWERGLPHFAGWFLDYEEPIVIVHGGDIGKTHEHLIRLGYDNIRGHLSGGFSGWTASGGEIETIENWSVRKLKDRMDSELSILDVRTKDKFEKEHLPRAHQIYVGEIVDHLGEIPDGKVVVYCDSGFKTSVATSILKKEGFQDVINLVGGVKAWKRAGYTLQSQ